MASYNELLKSMQENGNRVVFDTLGDETPETINAKLQAMLVVCTVTMASPEIPEMIKLAAFSAFADTVNSVITALTGIQDVFDLLDPNSNASIAVQCVVEESSNKLAAVARPGASERMLQDLLGDLNELLSL